MRLSKLGSGKAAYSDQLLTELFRKLPYTFSLHRLWCGEHAMYILINKNWEGNVVLFLSTTKLKTAEAICSAIAKCQLSFAIEQAQGPNSRTTK